MRNTRAIAVAFVLVTLVALATGCGSSKGTIKSVSPTDGLAGTIIKIAGSDFGGSQGKGSVRVGTLNAPVSKWSNAQITAIVPRSISPGNYPVTVINGAGTSNKVFFTVNKGFTSTTPLPAMLNYLKTNSIDSNGLSFSVVTTSKTDPNWKIDVASRAGTAAAYFLVHQATDGWSVIDYKTTQFTAKEIKDDGGPDDLLASSTASTAPKSTP